MASPEMDRLEQEVTETEGVSESAVTLLNGLSAYILANVNDPAALTAFATRLDAQANALAAAVAANPVPGA
jgi:hypothetical protein